MVAYEGIGIGLVMFLWGADNAWKLKEKKVVFFGKEINVAELLGYVYVIFGIIIVSVSI